jgi:hypothetical protein
MSTSMAALKILFISFCCLIVGSAGVCATISGPDSILFAPLFAVFGWFYLVPIYLLVALMWGLYRFRLRVLPWRVLFIISGSVLGGILMGLQSVIQGTNAKDLPMHEGLLLGGILAGGVASLMVTLIKPHDADFSVERMAAGGSSLLKPAFGARRHRSPRR